MRILIADKLAPEGAAFLTQFDDVDVTIQTGLDDDELVVKMREHDGIVVRSAVKVRRNHLEKCMAEPGSQLKAIARAGVGVDNIDLDAATEYGIAVMNSASASTITTAEHAFALMIALARNIAPAAATMRAGGWDRSAYVGAQLYGRTLGVVGMGRIGQTMARRALAFGMEVIGYDPFVTAPTVLDGAVRMVSTFDELIPDIDIVSFHVPRTEQTAGMLNAAAFAKARPGLLVVNAARGGIVDEAALLAALDAGQCAGAAIDVYESEPPPADSPLRAHPKVVTTPHLGASTKEAQEAVAVDACKAILTFLRGEGLDGAVNAGGLDLHLTPRQRAFADLAERMTPVLRAVAAAPGVDAARIEIRGEALVGKADAIGRYALASLLQANLEEPVTIINAASIADHRGIAVETAIAPDAALDGLEISIRRGDTTHRIVGTVFEDGLPHITNLDGFAMDIVPAGPLVLITNSDEPGRVGMVGQIFGDAGVNIAEMRIGRRDQEALMVLVLDKSPSDKMVAQLHATPGIHSVATVALPGCSC